jgi:ribonuclease HIII
LSDITTKNIEEAPRIKDYQIGCDEVGVGDYFGPVVSCAVIVGKKEMEEL